MTRTLPRTLTIVMYHYVRDLVRSRYPVIKGLSLERFRRQLDHIQRCYTPISAREMVAAMRDPTQPLPENSILLTFDDGFSDHFDNVFPLLDERGISGCFFPVGQAVLEHKVLDVHKIQFLLAAVPDPAALLDQVFAALPEFSRDHRLGSREEYLTAAAEPHRYDPREVILLKRLLQRELPQAVRTELVRRLFSRYVSADEPAFACELYMSADQIACMRRHGMHIGSHGYSHAWLNHIPAETQAAEVSQSLQFIKTFGVGPDDWTMCYPYGGFNEETLNVLRACNCPAGFSVEPRIADLDADDPLTLPRLDTNDLPS
jgi:peptidoglycan/xylan/chitin deacetylase (PgdA/CDA1 family)